MTRFAKMVKMYIAITSTIECRHCGNKNNYEGQEKQVYKFLVNSSPTLKCRLCGNEMIESYEILEAMTRGFELALNKIKDEEFELEFEDEDELDDSSYSLELSDSSNHKKVIEKPKGRCRLSKCKSKDGVCRGYVCCYFKI